MATATTNAPTRRRARLVEGPGRQFRVQITEAEERAFRAACAAAGIQPGAILAQLVRDWTAGST